jgi:putative oxidoreductase
MSSQDLGKLILRASLGVLMLMHGISKLFGGIEGIVARVQDAGLPGVFAYGVYVGEVIAPLLMIAGFWTRPAAAVFAFNMVVAVALAHPGEILMIRGSGAWGIELQALFFFGAVAVALLGAGRYSVSRGRGRLD